ncbi:MAG: homoserine kinase [Gammaproteobacteria bacterium]|nr:homoserine kinase [Gammaproteobacteria bacterium]
MSVFTPIEHEQLVQFLLNYNVGELKNYRGISEGIENTNYFVNTIKERAELRFVLTIFEHHNFEEMQYYLNLMHHLADHKVPSADPVADNKGHYLRMFGGKPIALVERLPGDSIVETTPSHCRQIGAAMGTMHSAGLSFEGHQPNPRGTTWFAQAATALQEKLPAEELEILNAEISFQKANRNVELPRGVIHADLFRDNTLWQDDQLSGIIDFYYACDDALLYDLAITVNDWCCNDDARLDKTRVQALLDGYHPNRPLLVIEQQNWPLMLRAGALRFWLSRLYDKHFPRAGELVHTKNPDAFKAILTDRIARHDEYHSYWLTARSLTENSDCSEGRRF